MASARSAIARALTPGAFGRDSDIPAVTLQERRDLSLIQVAAFAGPSVRNALQAVLGLTLDERPNRASGAGDTQALWTGPDRWLIVAPAGRSPKAALAQTLGSDQAAITELDHGRTVIRVSGAKARTVLAKGCLLDLHPKSFAPGQTAQTALFHVNVLIHAVGADSFDLYVPRSYGQSFWEALTDASGEFGCRVVAA